MLLLVVECCCTTESYNRNVSCAGIVVIQLSEQIEAEQHRREIARYRYLRDHLRDAAMREHLDRLIEEAEQRLAQILSA